ncbi:MAG TPA: methyltransferase domain-containing protein [Steroidobacteraceae bacterium]|nr:methyltransferase domain-containing protein [Steroidobacteraceae bacterium]
MSSRAGISSGHMEDQRQILVLAHPRDELAILEGHIKAQSRPGQTMAVLEAGCGREWYFRMEGIDYELTGIDLDAEALKARQEIKKDLTHGIVGDLRTAQLPAATFDLVYNAYVLEHVAGAELVLRNMVHWLKPGGLLIVRVPDKDSVQGFLARTTPHFFHVWYYRWVWKLKDAGKPGFAPYPTVYDEVISRAGMRDFCAANGLAILEEIGLGTYRRGHGLLAKLTPFIARMVSLLTLGKVHDKYVDRTLVARKVA